MIGNSLAARDINARPQLAGPLQHAPTAWSTVLLHELEKHAMHARLWKQGGCKLPPNMAPVPPSCLAYACPSFVCAIPPTLIRSPALLTLDAVSLHVLSHVGVVSHVAIHVVLGICTAPSDLAFFALSRGKAVPALDLEGLHACCHHGLLISVFPPKQTVSAEAGLS